MKSIRICINKHIKENMQDCDIKKLTALKIKSTLNKIQSTKMRQYTFDVFNESLREAKNNKLIKFNECDSLKRPKHQREKGLALTLDQQKEFLQRIKTNRSRDYFLFLLGTGCRPFEPLTIFKSDIDFTNKRIRIRGTKTEDSDRFIPLFDFLQDTLKSILNNSTSKKLFNVSQSTIKRDFEKVRENQSFYMSLKTLRHTFATRLFEMGFEIEIISKWLGHASVEITRKVYVDILSELEDKKVLENDTYFDTYFFTFNEKDD